MAEGRTAGALRRIPGEGALAAHAVGAAFVIALAPRGFPVSHPRFWTNSAAPLLVLAAAAAALVVLLRERPRWAGVVIDGLAGAWLGGAVAGRLLFPESLSTLWIAGLAVAIALLAGAVVLPERKRVVTRYEAVATVIGVILGALFVAGLRPAAAATNPVGASADIEATDGYRGAPVRVEGESVYVRTGDYTISYRPLLSFDRVSPDRFWSLLAPPARGRVALLGSGEVQRFDDGATLAVSANADEPAIAVNAATPTRSSVYSHLNSYCVFTLEGCRRPGVAFSATGAKRFEVLPAGYPSGAPARFACLMADGRFTVREASSGEKGPFKELSSGPLAPGDPLKLQFFDEGDWVASLELSDWSAQASTELSPTAGWGVPQNAIEFQRLDDSGAVNVWVSLAATSVGRGWDTVGHRAGTYVNRSRVEWRDDSEAQRE